MDLIIKADNKRKAELVSMGKLPIGNQREYDRNMNWRDIKEEIRNRYCNSMKETNVFLVTATCRYLNLKDAFWYMQRFRYKCPYIVVAERKNKYHLHYIVNEKENAIYFKNGLKMAKRFNADFAVDIQPQDSLEKTVSYLMKEVIRSETHIDFFHPAQSVSSRQGSEALPTQSPGKPCQQGNVK